MAINGSDGSIILTTKIDEAGLKKGFASMRSFVSKVGKSFLAIGVAASATTVAITKMAVSAYADYEQLVGGVETLFKGSAKKVINYANDAFSTAGISANEYMQQVTSFSASLIRSTAGDTDKAADIANMALVDISDNVNKMGSSMESVTLAYQGFAKQQYMLLDNLKLGYGGTKTEMERLLKDAQALTGVKYDINNLADVYSAIHAIQEELGITGTTAKEAETTITGSANMMKAAWQNVLSAIAGGGELDRAINNLVYSISVYFANIVPVVERSLVGIGKLIEQVGPLLVQNVASALVQSIPSLVNAVYQMIVGLAKGIWTGIKALFTGGKAQIQKQVSAVGGGGGISAGGISSGSGSGGTSGGGSGGGSSKKGKSAEEEQIDAEIKAIQDKIKALQKENKQIQKNDKANQKANQKQLASFDDLNVLGSNQMSEADAMIDKNNEEIDQLQEQLNLLREKKQAIQDAASASDGSAGGIGGIGDIGGGFGGLEGFEPINLGDMFSFEVDETLMEKLKGVAVLVGLIGTSLLAWKISDLLLTDSAKFLGQLQIIAGWLGIVAGAILLLQGYSDAWANGIDWGNLATTIGGLALLISGIAIAISPMAAAFVAVGGGIALVVLGIKDIIDNGPTLQNILTIITGALISTAGVLAAMGKISVFGSLLPILGTLAGAFVTLYGVTDAWINGLDWANFSAILGGLTIAITAIGLSSDAMYTGIALVVGGIIALVVGMKDFIQNGASMQNTILIIGGAIAVAVGLATAGLSVLVSAIIGTVAAVGAFVAAIVLEEPAIMSVTEAQENYTQAKEKAVQAEEGYISAVDNANASMERLTNAEKSAGISGEKLFKQVQSGKLDYKDLTEAQKEVYKAYIDNDKKQKELEESTKALAQAKKDETIASFENDLALAKESGSYDEYKASVIAAFEEGTLSAEEARVLIGKSMSEMSTDAQQTFMQDIPNDIKDGLDPNKYETSKKQLTDFFGEVWDGIKLKFSDVGSWFKTTFENAWKNIKEAFANWGEFFGGLWDTVKTKFTDFGTKMGNAIGDAVKSGINSVLSLIENTINKAINLINGGIDLMNLIPGVSVGKIGPITLPRLARGAVIPPNREFLAVLGDQKHGTNIEAPADLIKQMVNEALNESGYLGSGDISINFTGNLAQLARVLKPQLDKETTRKGAKLVIGGAY